MTPQLRPVRFSHPAGRPPPHQLRPRLAFLRFFSLLFVIFLILCLGQTLAEPPADQPDDLAALRSAFLEAMKGADHPEELLAVAAWYTGRTWEMVAQGMVARLQDEELRLQVPRIEDPDPPPLRRVGTRPRRVQISGLKRMFQAVAVTAAVLALERGDADTLAQVQDLRQETLALARSKTQDLGVLVTLSRGTMIMLSWTLKGLDQGDRVLAAIDTELDRRLAEAGSIRGREDLQAYARLFALGANYLEGMFRLVFLLGETSDPSLERELKDIRRAWLKHLSGSDSLMDTWVLTLTATAEASFPVAQVLAGR